MSLNQLTEDKVYYHQAWRTVAEAEELKNKRSRIATESATRKDKSIKRRTCLKCSRKFKPNSIYNRLCRIHSVVYSNMWE